MQKRTGTKQRSDDRTTKNLSRLIMVWDRNHHNYICYSFSVLVVRRGDESVWWGNQEILSVEIGTITQTPPLSTTTTNVVVLLVPNVSAKEVSKQEENNIKVATTTTTLRLPASAIGYILVSPKKNDDSK